MLTHDVSLDEPVSQLTFYRMVQAAVARTRSPSRDPAAAFRIDFGRSVLGRVGGVLYSIGTTLGAKVMAVTSWQLQQPPHGVRAPLTAGAGVKRAARRGAVQQQRALLQLRPLLLLPALHAACGG